MYTFFFNSPTHLRDGSNDAVSGKGVLFWG